MRLSGSRYGADPAAKLRAMPSDYAIRYRAPIAKTTRTQAITIVNSPANANLVRLGVLPLFSFSTKLEGLGVSLGLIWKRYRSDVSTVWNLPNTPFISNATPEQWESPR